MNVRQCGLALNFERAPHPLIFWGATLVPMQSLPRSRHSNEFARYHLGSAEDESVIVMGDFSAGCHHLNDHELSMTTLFQNENLNSLINDDADTTTTSTYCPYDRLLVGGALMNHSLESGVFYFDQALSLTGELTRSISDHYPVWVRFDMTSLSEQEGDGQGNEDTEGMTP